MKYFFTYLTETEFVIDTRSEIISEMLKQDLELRLKNAYMRHLNFDGKTFRFSAPPFRFVWNGFDLFNAVSKGEITLKLMNNSLFVSYKFVFTEYFLIALLFSLIPFLGIFPEPVYRILTFLGIWIIYVIATILSAHRFENYLKKFFEKAGVIIY